MLATKELVGKRVLHSWSIWKSDPRKAAKQHSTTPVRSALHRVAGQTQHQTGGAWVWAAGASGAAANACGLVKMGDDGCNMLT